MSRQTTHATTPLPRIELFFKTESELRERTRFLLSRGTCAFNLVNKNKGEPLKKWAEVVEELGGHACVHYSLKFNRAGGPELAYERFLDALLSFGEADVLVVSGSGKKPKCFLDAVGALGRLGREARKKELPKICVAFNPFLEGIDGEEERMRLVEKVETGVVRKVYLQFGSDRKVLQSSLSWLSTLRLKEGGTLEVCGSIFLPTAKLIAQQKFRPWNGVILSEEFLSSPQKARRIVVETMALYARFGVELLIEAPGVRNDKDFDFLEALLQESDDASSTSGEETTLFKSELVNTQSNYAKPMLNTKPVLNARGKVKCNQISADKLFTEKNCKKARTVG